VTFEVLTAVFLRIPVFSNVVLCCQVCGFQLSEGTWCLHIQVSSSHPKTTAAHVKICESSKKTTYTAF